MAFALFWQDLLGQHELLLCSIVETTTAQIQV